jgi:hypothetical protein
MSRKVKPTREQKYQKEHRDAMRKYYRQKAKCLRAEAEYLEVMARYG